MLPIWGSREALALRVETLSQFPLNTQPALRTIPYTVTIDTMIPDPTRETERDLTVISVVVLVIGLCAFLAFAIGSVWLLSIRQHGARASLGSDGIQKIDILVKGRYRPNTVVVKKGIPVRLLFNRQENMPCSERVIFSAFRQECWLPPFVTTAVEFTPTQSGDFLFTCAEGMYQGRLVVEEATRTWFLKQHMKAPAISLHSSPHPLDHKD